MTRPWHGALPRELRTDLTLHHAAPRSMPARTLRQGGRNCHPDGSLRPQSFRRYQQRGCNMHSTSNIKLNTAGSARCSPWLTFSGAHVTVDNENFIGSLPLAAEPRNCVTQLKGFEGARTLVNELCFVPRSNFFRKARLLTDRPCAGVDTRSRRAALLVLRPSDSTELSGSSRTQSEEVCKREVQYVDSHAAFRDAFVCPALHVAKNTLDVLLGVAHRSRGLSAAATGRGCHVDRATTS